MPFLIVLGTLVASSIGIVAEGRKVFAVDGSDATGEAEGPEHLAAVKSSDTLDQHVAQVLGVEALALRIEGGVGNRLGYEALRPGP